LLKGPQGRKDISQKQWGGGGGALHVTKARTLQQKLKTAFFTYAYKYDESKVKG
jgi:hypothetical protein